MGRSGRVSTTPPPRRSSPPSSGRSCPGTSSPTPTTPNGSWPTGASSSTTTTAGTVHDRHDEPDQLREHPHDHGPRPGSRIKKPSTVRGEPQRADRGARRSGAIARLGRCAPSLAAASSVPVSTPVSAAGRPSPRAARCARPWAGGSRTAARARAAERVGDHHVAGVDQLLGWAAAGAAGAVLELATAPTRGPAGRR